MLTYTLLKILYPLTMKQMADSGRSTVLLVEHYGYYNNQNFHENKLIISGQQEII